MLGLLLFFMQTRKCQKSSSKATCLPTNNYVHIGPGSCHHIIRRNTYTTGACNSYDGANYTPYQTHDTTWYGGANYTPYQTPHTTGYRGANYTPYQTPHATGYGGANYTPYQMPHATGYRGANYTPYQTPHATGYGGANYPSLPTTPPLHPAPKTRTTPPPGMEGNTPEVNQQTPIHLPRPPIHPEQARYARNKRGFPDPSPICNQ